MNQIDRTEVKLKRLLNCTELKTRAADEGLGIEGYFTKGILMCAGSG